VIGPPDHRPRRRRNRGLRHTALLGMAVGAALLLAAVSLHLALRAGGGRALDLEPPERATPTVHPPADLVGRDITFPVRGVDPATIVDTFTDRRGLTRVHNALDIMAPRGTAVLAVDGGTVSRLGNGGAGGITVYQIDDAGRYAFYYAHLDHIAPGLTEGQVVKRGDVLGFVGTTGNAPPNAPHLHFAIYEIGDDRTRWGGRPVNPFPLWRRPAE
jgi:murein DD-endopeptidase MepM/ murein hydrolase activator NlpD